MKILEVCPMVRHSVAYSGIKYTIVSGYDGHVFCVVRRVRCTLVSGVLCGQG